MPGDCVHPVVWMPKAMIALDDSGSLLGELGSSRVVARLACAYDRLKCSADHGGENLVAELKRRRSSD